MVNKAIQQSPVKNCKLEHRKFQFSITVICYLLPLHTGHVGWGISWYINGLLIPEINVVRGKTYTFVVEGGHDPDIPAQYHPFYITDDSVGGYEHKTEEEKAVIEYL